MGVAGSGKSTIGKILSDRIGWNFYDGDDFHTAANLEKMSHGIPLNDEERQDWLLALKDLINNLTNQNSNAILACSALKENYRQILQDNHQNIIWVYLKGSYEQIYSRIKQRQDHFFSANLLKSQFATLEEPKADLTIDISLNQKAIVEEIINYITKILN
jgi:gluconokinase